MDCSTAETIVGISPLVNGGESTDEEAALDAAELLLILVAAGCLARTSSFIYFPRGIFGELNCKFHVGFRVPRMCACAGIKII